MTLENASIIIRAKEVSKLEIAKRTGYDYSELLGKLRARKITQEELAKTIHLNPSTLNQKLNNKSEFSQSEIRDILKAIGEPIEMAVPYFFT